MNESVINMRPSRSGKIFVIGYGSELRGEDRAGRIVAERIAECGYPRLEAVSVHQPGPELALNVAESDMTIFVDAVEADQPVHDILDLAGLTSYRPSRPSKPRRNGTIHVTNPMLVGLHPADLGASVGHNVDPWGLLLLARNLYGRSPRAYLVGIPASHFNFGDELTEDTQRAVDEAVEIIKQLSLWKPRGIHHSGEARRIYLHA